MAPRNRWLVRRCATAWLPVAETVDEVAEHRAGLDRRQLVGVPDEHEPRVRRHRLEQPGQQGQRHHRRLVDDDHVVGQRVGPVVAEPVAALRPPAQQPVDGGGRQRADTASAAASGKSGLAVSACTAWVIRAAALPVGAARATRSRGPSSATSDAMSRAMVVVLPVPGPPVTMAVRCVQHDPRGLALLRIPRAPGRPPPAPRSSRSASTMTGRAPRATRGRRPPGPPRASSGRGRAVRGRDGRRRMPRPGSRPRPPPSHSGRATRGRRCVGPARSVTGQLRPRSTHTEPWRAARTANATANRADSSVSPTACPTRDATWTSAAVRISAALKSRSSPLACSATSRWWGGRCRTSVMPTATRPPKRVETASTRPSLGRHAKTPHGCPSNDRRLRADHAAHVEVEHAAEVVGEPVARLPPPQEPVQRNGVEQRLKGIARPRHGLAQPVGRVGVDVVRLVALTDPRGLVVGDEVAPVHPASPTPKTRSSEPDR